MFKVMEEYNWENFVVITSLYPGYETYVDYVKSFIDTSYFKWELQDVLTFDMSADGLNDIRARRLLQQIDAQVLLVYCSHDEAQYLFAMAADSGLVGPGYIWIIPSLAVGNPDIPPPDSFPVGLISIITDRWRMSLRKRVRDGVAIVVKGMQSFRKQRGFIPEGHSDCHNPVKTTLDNDTLFRYATQQRRTQAPRSCLGGSLRRLTSSDRHLASRSLMSLVSSLLPAKIPFLCEARLLLKVEPFLDLQQIKKRRRRCGR